MGCWKSSWFAVALLCAAFAMTGKAQSARNSQIELNIPAQPIGDALNEFGRQSGLHVVLYSGLGKGVVSRPLSGSFSARAALETLLADTNLRYEYLDASTVAILAKGDAPRAANDGSTQIVDRRVAEAESATTSADSAAGAEGSQEQRDAAASDPEIAKLEEVVVTAQKRAERQIEVPMSITAISGDKLVAAGIDNALDLSFAVPSVSVSETGPGRQVIVIRGIGSIRGSSSLTGVYLDEMPVTGAQDGFVQAYPDLRTIDLERVEVLKGPQGTLFGEGAAGGVIRFITTDPNLSGPGGSLSTELYSTSDGGWSKEVTGIANLPLADTFAIRIAAVYEDKTGWIDQPSIGREDINDSEVKHVRLKALYAPTDALRIKGMAEIHRNDGGASNIVNQEPRKASNFLQAYDPFAPTDYSDDYELFNVAVTYDFEFAELLSSTSYATLESVQSFTQLQGQEPNPTLEISMPELLQDTSIVSQEIRLTSGTDGPIDWTAGASYKRAKLVAGFGDAGVDAILSGGTLILTDFLAGDEPTTKSESWAGFLNVSYRFADRIEVGGGLRQFFDKREAFDPIHPERGILADDFEKLTFRAYAKFQASENVNLYVNVASGFRSGGFNSPDIGPRGGPASYQPEETLFYEVGAKMALLGGRVRLDTALFYGEFQGMQEANLITSPVDGDPLQFTTNSQDAELKGIEWDLGWLATDRLTLTFAGDVTDSEITEVDPGNQTPAFFVGDPINLVPEYSVSLSADYQFQWSTALPGFFLLSFDRKGESFYSDRSNPLVLVTQGAAPEVTFLNASVGAEWGGWKLSLFGRNLLDEEGAINAAPTGWTAQARPRTVGIGISKAF